MPIRSRVDYEEVRKLGQGSFGPVTLVKKSTCGTLYVIREYNMTMIQREFNGDPSTINFITKRARAQAGLMMSLQQANLARVFGSFEEKVSGDEIVHVVLEYYNSGSFESILNDNKPLSEMQLCSWAKQLVMALQFLHSHGIAHRDIRTHNVFLLSENRFVKLGELGLYETLQQIPKKARSECLPYCPPEVLNSHKFSRKGDSWSLGVLIYRITTLKFPFYEHENHHFKDHVINGTPAPIPKRFSSELRAFVRELLRKNPADRPAMAQLLADNEFITRPIASEALFDLGLDRIKGSEIPEHYKATICSAMQAKLITADMLSTMTEDQIRTLFPEIGVQAAVESWKEEDACASKPARLLKAAEVGDVNLLKRILTLFNGRHMLRDEFLWAPFDGDTPLHRACRFGQLDVVELLISEEFVAPDDARNNLGNCPIHEAITNNHVRIVEMMLINNPLLLEIGGEYGWTPLQRSAAFGAVDCVQLLLKRCANPTAYGTSNCEDMAVHLASYFGRGPVVQHMLNVLPNLIDKKNKVGATPLFRAAAGGSVEVVNLLVSLGASVDPFQNITPLGSSEVFCFSPMHEACAYGHLDVVKMLIKYGADINRRSRTLNPRGIIMSKKSGSLPIHFAAEHGHLSVVQFLLTMNCDFLEEKDIRGCSLLNLAADNGHLRLVKFLLEQKANIESTDHLNRTPLIQAASSGYIEIVKFLLKNGANIYAKSHRATPNSIRHADANQSGTSKTSMAIHHAAERCHLDVVKYLLEVNSDLLEIKDSQGKSPLSCAISSAKGAVAMVEFLLSKKANTETRDSRGWTPLHQACRLGCLDIVDLLLRHRANVYATTDSGDMAIHLAVANNHLLVIRRLFVDWPDLIGAKNKRDNTPYRQALLDKTTQPDVIRFLRQCDASVYNLHSVEPVPVD